METAKLLVMMAFVDAYCDAVRHAYENYVDFRNQLSFDKNNVALITYSATDALVYATRANAIYDGARYADLDGLPNNLRDMQERERKAWEINERIDDIVLETKRYIRNLK